MGRGIKAKPKKKSKRVITEFELNRAQARMDRKYETLSAEITSTATKFMKDIAYYTRVAVFGADLAEIQAIQKAEDDVADRIKDGTLTWDEIYNTLSAIGIYSDGVKYDDEGKVIGYE